MLMSLEVEWESFAKFLKILPFLAIPTRALSEQFQQNKEYKNKVLFRVQELNFIYSVG